MKRALVVVITLLVALATLDGGQRVGNYALTEVPGALTVYSNVLDRRFFLGVTGKRFTLLNNASPDHLSVTSDGRFLQIFSVQLTDFHDSRQDGDDSVLKKCMEFKANSFKVTMHEVESHFSKLPKGRTVLLWSFNPHDTPQIKQQLFLMLHYDTYVVVLNSVVQEGQNGDDLRQWLLRIAQSFYPQTVSG